MSSYVKVISWISAFSPIVVNFDCLSCYQFLIYTASFNYHSQGNCLSAIDYRTKFEGDLKTLGMEFKRMDVYVPSFHETYPLIQTSKLYSARGGGISRGKGVQGDKIGWRNGEWEEEERKGEAGMGEEGGAGRNQERRRWSNPVTLSLLSILLHIFNSEFLYKTNMELVI